MPRNNVPNSWDGFKLVPMSRPGTVGDPIGMGSCDIISGNHIRVKIIMREKVRVSQKEIPTLELFPVVKNGELIGVEMKWESMKKLNAKNEVTKKR